MQQRLRLVRKEAHVGEAARRRPSLRARGAWIRRRRSRSVSRSFDRSRSAASIEHVEVLRQADVARVHQDEAIGEAVLARERVVLRSGDDRVAVGPVVDDVDPRRIGALLLDQAAAHPVAERDDARRRCRSRYRLMRSSAALTARFWKSSSSVATSGKMSSQRNTKRAPVAPRGPERGKADNRRIGQRDDDVGPADAEAGRRRGREVADVVRRARHEPALAAAACRSRAGCRRPRCASRVTRRRPRSRLGARRIQRPSGDDRHLGAVAADEIFGQLGQELTGRGLIGPVRPVEEADLHTSASRCARYQSIVRRRPARKSVVALKPNRFSARRDVEHAPWLAVRLGAIERQPSR